MAINKICFITLYCALPCFIFKDRTLGYCKILNIAQKYLVMLTGSYLMSQKKIYISDFYQ